ncbi:polysaccharide deacetylase family protein [Pseudonocardia sp.]|uniref:polysaccharide deacetylase family protein n=1 Tax=Pseudonocardia sp. TaxID=60912 RepID=UPI003D0FEB17
MTDGSGERPLSVCITFDYDALSLWAGMLGSTNPTQISRGEFAAVAMPRILTYLRSHRIPATFATPGHTLLAYPDIAKAIAADGHEFAHHGWVHELVSLTDEAGEREVFERGFEAFEKVLGIRPTGYRAPGFDFSPRTVSLLQEFGFSYDSSFMGDDFNAYYLREGDQASPTQPYRFGGPVDLVELPASWALTDVPCFEFVWGALPGLRPPSAVEEIWRGDFDFAVERNPGGIYILTLHPQTIGRGHRWLMFERLVEHFANSDNVVFETLGAYAARWRSENPHDKWCATPSVHAPATS